jgi:hypothetical protein
MARFNFNPVSHIFMCSPQFIKMKFPIIFTALLFYLQGNAQIIPNVSVDSLTGRMFPIYYEAVKSGIYDLPRDTAWKKLKTYESGAISFRVPENWLDLGALGSVVEVAFDASGLYFPETFNDRPVLVGVFLLNQRGRTLQEAKDSALKDYRTNPDRIFETNFVDTVYNYKLTTGGPGYVLHTRFLRKSNQLNQSRYDLILFSEKYKKAYSVMVSVQYADPTYAFENTNSLAVFAARLFNQVLLR